MGRLVGRLVTKGVGSLVREVVVVVGEGVRAGGGRNTDNRTQARSSPISSPSLRLIIAFRRARGVSSSFLARGLLPPACGVEIGEETAKITVKE